MNSVTARAHCHEGLLISTRSATSTSLPDSSVDYVFIDPPFGANRYYSELNFMWEAWLHVFTDQVPEAVESPAQGKDRGVYQRLMAEGFAECYRVLKPGRWMTVEFSNTSAGIWNAIQTAIGEAGFVVADVRALSKGQGSINAYITPTAVKQDLVISSYKPNAGLEERFKLEAGTENGVWDFVRTHLRQLPVFVSKDNQAEVIAERQNYLLFDRMVAFHVQRGVTVPLSAAEFYAGLEQRFPPRDGMYFLSDQVAEYDKKRMTVREVLQLQLFVSDEASAIQWLRQQLLKKPQTAGELNPQFMQEIGGWQKAEKMLELDELLEQNFLRYDGRGEVPSQIDLEAAKSGVAAADAAYRRALSGATEEEKRMALAQLRQVEEAVKVYQAQYDRIAGNPYSGMMAESLQLQQATLMKEAAQAQYDKVLKGATQDQIAGAYAQLAAARAQLTRLQEGAKPAQINAAKANVKQAEAALYLAQLQVDKTTIKAPATGFIYQLDATEGALTGAGKAVAVIFSNEMKIQIAVEESRAKDVRIEQPATIRVDAFPDRTFQGKITAIAPVFDAATRTVKVTVRPTGEDATVLRSGMFASVELMEQ